MIESVLCNENGEDNQTGRVQASYKLPKNIRQVGKSNANKKIYVEDYVMTFIKQLTGEDYSKCRIAVLVGQYIKAENCRNIFISGAIEVEDIDVAGEIVFSNDTWAVIYENIKKYFVDAEIVGWFIGGPAYMYEDEDKILKAHIDNFAGQDKTLLTYDNMEKEEAFFLYENNRLSKQEGYYIYYERNTDMQNYMVDHKKTQSDEIAYDDRVSREIRTVIQNKKPADVESKAVPRLMYAAGTLLAVIILIVGAAMLNNYEQMKNMQNTLNSLTQNLNTTETQTDNSVTKKPSDPGNGDKMSEALEKNSNSKKTKAKKDSLEVKVVSGNVDPLKNKEKAAEKENNKTAVNSAEVNKTADNNDKKTSGKKPTKKDNKTQVTKKKTSSASTHVNKTTTEKKQVRYYTVKAGDTLAGISFKLYNSANYVKKIMKLNNIVDQDKIIEGQKLIVP